MKTRPKTPQILPKGIEPIVSADCMLDTYMHHCELAITHGLTIVMIEDIQFNGNTGEFELRGQPTTPAKAIEVIRSSVRNRQSNRTASLI